MQQSYRAMFPDYIFSNIRTDRKVELNLRARSAYLVRGVFAHKRRERRLSQEALHFEGSR